MFVFKLIKSQLAENRQKCELLEQSLRVLAQENLDLEGKNLQETSSKSLKTSRSVSPSPVSAQIQSPREDDEEAYLSDSEEFFDIGMVHKICCVLFDECDLISLFFVVVEDDPLTDEDQENKSSDVSTENQSLALRSCCDSLTEIPNHHKKEAKAINSGALNACNINENSKFIAQSMQDEVKLKSLIEFDPITGWR